MVVQVRAEGLYCPAGDFYVDPWKPVERALITHAHGDHLQGSAGSYLATQASIPILRQRIGAEAPLAGIEYGVEATYGRTRVSFHPAGHILGSAQIRIETEGEVWVVSGDYKRTYDPTCAAFEVVPCDVFITEATFAAPIYRWQEGIETAREILAWWKAVAATGGTAVLFCYALGKTQRILAELARLENVPQEPVLLHGAMLGLTEIYRQAGVRMLATEHLGDKDAKVPIAGRLVLAPPSAYRSPWMRRFKEFETGFASGWVRVRGALRQRGHDRGFVLSDHADWRELTETIVATGAKKILVTHGRPDVLVRWLQEQGHDAAELKTEYGKDEGED